MFLGRRGRKARLVRRVLPDPQDRPECLDPLAFLDQQGLLGFLDRLDRPGSQDLRAFLGPPASRGLRVSRARRWLPWTPSMECLAMVASA